MPTMLLAVHSPVDSKFLTAYFKKIVPHLELTVIPVPEKGRDFDTNAELVLSYELPHSPDVIVVESNYGIPSCPEANKTLLEKLLDKFPDALTIAHGSTMSSLTAALETDPRIMIMGKGNVNPKGCDPSRVQSLTTIKNLLNERVPIQALTHAFNLSLALSEHNHKEPNLSPDCGHRRNTSENRPG